jgi:hypothetical protein
MSEKLKFKKYNRKSCYNIRKGIATIWCSRKGAMNLSKELIRLIDLGQNDTIEFYQDENNPDDWYFCKVYDGEGFSLRSAGQGQLVANSVKVSNTILDSIEGKPKTATLKVSREPILYGGKSLYLIITSEPIRTS